MRSTHARWLRAAARSWAWCALGVLGLAKLCAAGCGSADCPAGYEKFGDICRSADLQPAIAPSLSAGASAGGGGSEAEGADVRAGAGGQAGTDAIADAASGGAARCRDGDTRSCPVMGVGACAFGIETCSAGAWGACVGAGVHDEVCNGRDDDCDGQTDEALEMACGSSTTAPCQLGKRTCVAGLWSECTGAVEPQPELCDAEMRDENCDGQVNEGCECTNGLTRACGPQPGFCKGGTQACVDGRWSGDCEGQERGPAEKCDGVDNDCDGLVDDGSLCETGYVCRGQSGCQPAEPAGFVNAAIRTSGGYYLTFVDGGGVSDPTGPLAISTAATQVGSNETFHIEWQDKTYEHFALRTASGGYLSAVGGGGQARPGDATSAVRTDARTIGSRESLRLDIDPRADTVTIRSLWSYYLTAQSGEGVRTSDDAPLRTDARSVGAWETFSMVRY